MPSRSTLVRLNTPEHKNPMKRLALLSASDKTGIIDLAKVLTTEFDFDIISSGGTARTLTEAGIAVTKVSDYTGIQVILGGRV